MASLPIDVLYGQGSIPKGSRFYGTGYIGRNHAHPRNHGAVSDETKIPRLPKAIVGSKSIRTLPSLLWRSEARATLEIACTFLECRRAKNERAGRMVPYMGGARAK